MMPVACDGCTGSICSVRETAGEVDTGLAVGMEFADMGRETD
jgi:hypothetical protein